MTDITAIPMANLCGFRPRPEWRNWPRSIATTTDNRKWQCGYRNRKYLYLWNYVTDRMTIATANLRFSTTPSSHKLTLGDRDNDRQPEIAMWTFCSPILQFLAVGRCRNHMANLCRARHHRKSQIWRWNLDAICQSSRDVIISGFGAISIFPVSAAISDCRSLL